MIHSGGVGVNSEKIIKDLVINVQIIWKRPVENIQVQLIQWGSEATIRCYYWLNDATIDPVMLLSLMLTQTMLISDSDNMLPLWYLWVIRNQKDHLRGHGSYQNEKINWQKSEELLLNDRRGNLIQGLGPRSIFLHGSKKLFPHRDSDNWPLKEPCPTSFQLRHQNLIVEVLQPIYISNKLSFGVREQRLLKIEEPKREKLFENSKNVLEKKRKIVMQKTCNKKDTHVNNNCYELHSRAINQ